MSTLSEEFDPTHLACLSNILPSITELIPVAATVNNDVDDDDDAKNKNASSSSVIRATNADTSEVSPRQLVFLLSKLMGLILGLGRKILVCCDDLQWCNSSMLTLIKELIILVGENNGEEGSRKKHNFLFVGMFRDEEVSESHSLME